MQHVACSAQTALGGNIYKQEQIMARLHDCFGSHNPMKYPLEPLNHTHGDEKILLASANFIDGGTFIFIHAGENHIKRKTLSPELSRQKSDMMFRRVWWATHSFLLQPNK